MGGCACVRFGVGVEDDGKTIRAFRGCPARPGLTGRVESDGNKKKFRRSGLGGVCVCNMNAFTTKNPFFLLENSIEIYFTDSLEGSRVGSGLFFKSSRV